MEFKVIFMGFALHCVLNAVLICKSFISNDESLVNDDRLVAVQEENEMFSSISDVPGKLTRLDIEKENTTEERALSVPK